jgi:alpha-tubulin suppressor-like RCC1 family protein
MKYIMSLLYVLVAIFLAATVQGQTHSTFSGGQYFFVQIQEGSGLFGWGHNYYGNLGLGDYNKRPTPQPVGLSPALSGNPVSLCTGDFHHCVRDDQNFVACTGRSDSGQVGGGVYSEFNSLHAVPTGISEVAHLACSRYSTMVTTTTGALKVWGRNLYGGLGLGHNSATQFVPVVGFYLLVFSFI